MWYNNHVLSVGWRYRSLSISFALAPSTSSSVLPTSASAISRPEGSTHRRPGGPSPAPSSTHPCRGCEGLSRAHPPSPCVIDLTNQFDCSVSECNWKSKSAHDKSISWIDFSSRRWKRGGHGIGGTLPATARRHSATSFAGLAPASHEDEFHHCHTHGSCCQGAMGKNWASPVLSENRKEVDAREVTRDKSSEHLALAQAWLAGDGGIGRFRGARPRGRFGLLAVA